MIHRICSPLSAVRLFVLLLLTGCGDVTTLEPGRGAAMEQGPMAKVYPAGEEPRVDRHGVWRGMEGDRVVWEVRYTRGVPTGPYREWNEEGELIATWPYNWEGKIEGWVRFFENGAPGFKLELTPDVDPEMDPIGRAAAFKTRLEERSS